MIKYARTAATRTAVYVMIGVTSVLDLVGLQFISDGFDIETKLSRGFSLVVASLLERFQDQLAFRFRSGNAERQDNLRRRFRARVPKIRRQVKRFDPLALGKNQSSFHDVPKLANIARPGVNGQHFHGIVAKSFNTGPVLPVELPDEMLRQERNVFFPIAQRGKVYRENS